MAATFLICSISFAQNDLPQQVNNLRLWHSPESTRIVFDVSHDVRHSMFTLKNPLRLVVDIKNVDAFMQIPTVDVNNRHIKAIRSGEPNSGILRFVFELKKEIQSSSFVLTPNELYGHRLVIDLIDINGAEDIAIKPPQAPEKPSALVPTKVADKKNAPILIAIDAGHGGEDPGAIGYRGSQEKKITLAIAGRLKKIIDDDPRFQSYMVRTGDYYVKLDRRRKIAAEQNADMFISVHADAFTRSSARGFSVFALSQRGATSAMAKALAAKENAADLIGGVSLADKDKVLAQVLVDLSMTNTINESVNLGGRVLKELAKLGKLHSKRVEQAGFAVLKSPDIPSILVETGFITNPDEERKLRSSDYQGKVALAIYTAINKYFQQTPYYNIANYQSPSIDNVLNKSSSSATSHHTVVRGDSLLKIAQSYGISLSELKRINGLRSNVAVLGKKLVIPNTNKKTKTTPSKHVVKRGDSLSKISKRYNVTIRSIKALNNLKKDTVYLGQVIKIPGGNHVSAPAKPTKHIVKRGDTLSEIAEKYGSNMSEIMRINGMRSQTVMLGQTLSIPQ